MMPHPPVAPITGWSTSLVLPWDHYVRPDSNDYSVHPCAVGRRVLVRVDLHRVSATWDGNVVADPRPWARHQTLTDPEHASAAALRRTRFVLRTARPSPASDCWCKCGACWPTTRCSASRPGEQPHDPSDQPGTAGAGWAFTLRWLCISPGALGGLRAHTRGVTPAARPWYPRCGSVLGATVGAVNHLPPAGAHGGDGPAVARALGMDPADLLDLSQNMNPVAPSVGAVVTRHLDALHRYPDDREATAVLAEALGVDPARVLLTNGGSEAIHLLTRVIGGRVRGEPEFGLHPRGGPDTDVIWRSDPHSPSGQLARQEEAANVWDEAFYALATGRWSAAREGAFVVGSLTKTFRCPGLRLGYVVAPEPQALAPVRAAQPHWSVSTLALSVIPDLLATADLPGWAAATGRLRQELVGLLTGHGMVVQAADAPWVLVAHDGLRERLAPHGVLVRDCASFGMPGIARVAVPGPDGMARLEQALDRR